MTDLMTSRTSSPFAISNRRRLGVSEAQIMETLICGVKALYREDAILKSEVDDEEKKMRSSCEQALVTQ